MPAGVALLALAVACAGPPGARAQPPLLVFAAASLADALRELARGWTGGRVDFAFGASSDLARQIVAGAPADVFFSADAARMDEVAKAGLVAGTPRTVLSNVLVVVVPADAAGAPATAGDLARVTRLALADPYAVPAGIYARGWLARRGLWAAVEPHVLPALDVRAALAAVETGAADAGVVYATDAAVSRRVRVAFAVPAADAPPIAYVVAPLATSKRAAAARAFADHVAGAEAAAVFRRRGFVVPPGS